MAAISSIVWPSMAASKRTRRNFSGNSASAVSRCAWNCSKRRGLQRSRTRAGAPVATKCVRDVRAVSGAQAVERETKRDSNEPGAEAVAVTKAIEPAIGPQQSFLGYIFSVSRIAQTPRATRKRAGRTRRGAPRTRAWWQPGLFRAPAHPDRATWLDRTSSCICYPARASKPASCTPNQTHHLRIGSKLNGRSG